MKSSSQRDPIVWARFHKSLDVGSDLPVAAMQAVDELGLLQLFFFPKVALTNS